MDDNPYTAPNNAGGGAPETAQIPRRPRRAIRFLLLTASLTAASTFVGVGVAVVYRDHRPAVATVAMALGLLTLGVVYLVERVRRRFTPRP